MVPIPVPADGSALRDVLPRYLEPKEWSLYVHLTSEWEVAGRPAPLEGSATFNLIRFAPEFLLEALPDGRAKEELRDVLREQWEDGPMETLTDLLSEGTLLAWGRPRSPEASLERIPNYLWEVVRYLDIEQSAVEFAVRERSQRIYRDVKVFHIEEAPDILGKVAQMSLIEAFSRFVVGPNEAGVIIEDDNVESWSSVDFFNPNEFAEIRRPIWSAAFESWHLSPRWNRLLLTTPEGGTTLPSRIERRAQILIRWLRRGRLEALGSKPEQTELLAVPRGLWSSPEIWIDFQFGALLGPHGALLERFEFREPGVSTGGVLPASASDKTRDRSSQAEDVVSTKDRGGRPAEYPWERVAEYLVILADTEGLPTSKGALVRTIQEYVEEIAPKRPGDTTVKNWLGPVDKPDSQIS